MTKTSNDLRDFDLWIFDLDMLRGLIETSWVVCVSHVKWIGEIWTELQSRHSKIRMTHMTLTFDLSFWKWRPTHRPLKCYMYAIQEVIQPNRVWAMEQTPQKHLISGVPFNSNDPCDLWHFVLKMDRDIIITSSTIYVLSIKQIGQIGTEPRSAQDKKIE